MLGLYNRLLSLYRALLNDRNKIVDMSFVREDLITATAKVNKHHDESNDDMYNKCMSLITECQRLSQGEQYYV